MSRAAYPLKLPASVRRPPRGSQRPTESHLISPSPWHRREPVPKSMTSANMLAMR